MMNLQVMGKPILQAPEVFVSEVNSYALFQAPSGKEIRINGFYDDYENVNQWKIRFSPNEIGTYSYRVFVKNRGKRGNQNRRLSWLLSQSIGGG